MIELFDAIDIAGENGLKAKLYARDDQDQGRHHLVRRARARRDAGGRHHRQPDDASAEREAYAFVQNVRTELKGRAAARRPQTGAAAGAKRVSAFGNAGDPITIRSTASTSNDVTKIAIFSGNVKAVQGEATLTSPEMEVTYEGSAVTGADKTKTPKDAAKPADTSPPQAADEGGKVKKVIAKNAVTLTQAGGQKATSRSCRVRRGQTDCRCSKATCVMSEEPDRKAIGDRAEIDQVAGTMLLTGPVVVTQGKNELRGRKLFFNRTNGKMNLTAAGAGNGRISRALHAERRRPARRPRKRRLPKGMAFCGQLQDRSQRPRRRDRRTARRRRQRQAGRSSQAT